MFYKSTDDDFQKVLEGITIKTLVVGEKMLLSEFHMEKGSRLPIHAHPQEQTGRLLKGRIILSIGNEKSEILPGDCWIVPSNAEHGAEVLEESIAIEVFSPVREDYLRYLPK
jgi:quercetin dioxygenase-like cupin family protein